jgi:hypothetical protein
MQESSVVPDLENIEESVPLEKTKKAKKPRTEKQVKQFQEALVARKAKIEQRKLEKIKMLIEKGLMKDDMLNKVKTKQEKVKVKEPELEPEEEPKDESTSDTDEEPEIVVIKKTKKEKKPKKKIIYLEEKEDESSDDDAELQRVKEKVFKSQRNKKSVVKTNNPSPKKEKVEYKIPINYFVD